LPEHTSTAVVHERHVVTRLGVTRLARTSVKFGSALIILRKTASILVHCGELEAAPHLIAIACLLEQGNSD
jgi:hypothetical protein